MYHTSIIHFHLSQEVAEKTPEAPKKKPIVYEDSSDEEDQKPLSQRNINKQPNKQPSKPSKKPQPPQAKPKAKPKGPSALEKCKSREKEADEPAKVTAEELAKYKELPPVTKDGYGATNRWVCLPAEVFPDEDVLNVVGWRSQITKTKKTAAVSWFFVKVQNSPNGHWFRFEQMSTYQMLSL